MKKIDIYKIFNKIPSNLRMYLECSFGTKLSERIWARRAISAGKDYLGAEEDIHRKFLMNQISEFSPIHSILEIGCGTGLNLYLLSKKFPDAEMKGIDINHNSVQYGNAYFEQEEISNVKLITGKADDLQQFQDKSFDVVFTDATLIYIGPDKIKKVVKEMLRISSKGLIFLEWNWFKGKGYPYGVYVGHWARVYKELLEEFVPKNSIQVNKLPKGAFNGDENWKKYGAIIKVCK